MEPASAGPAARLGKATDVSQVFEDERIPRLARVNQRFAEHMVAVAAETSQSVAQAPQMAACRPGAFRQKPASQGHHPFFEGPPHGFPEISSVAGYRRTADPAVDPDHLPGRRWIIYLPLDGDMEEPSLGLSTKFRRTGPKTPQAFRLAIQPDGNLQSASDHGEGNPAGLPVEVVGSGVESNRRVAGLGLRDGLAALLESAGGLQGFDRLHAGGDGELAGEIKLGAERMISFKVKIRAVQTLALPPEPGDSVKGLGVLAEGLAKRLSLARGQGQSELHGLENDHTIGYRGSLCHKRSHQGGTPHLPELKFGGSAVMLR
jgi:hypothetical protein